MQVLDNNGNSTEIKMQLPKFNLSDAEWEKRDAEIEAEILKQELFERQMAYENCGVGEEYIKCTMKNFNLDQKKQIEMRDAARKFFRQITTGNISNMLLHGDAGQGKTRLMCSLLQCFATTIKTKKYDINQYYVVEYRTSKDICDLLNKTKSFSNYKTYDKVVNDMVFADVLAIDEVGKGGTEFEYDYLFSILDKRYQNHKPTMLATNMSYDEVKSKFGNYGMSRLNFHNNLIVLDTRGLPDFRQM